MSSGNDAADAVNDLLEQYEKKLGDVAPKVGGLSVKACIRADHTVLQSVGIQLGLSAYPTPAPTDCLQVSRCPAFMRRRDTWQTTAGRQATRVQHH